MSRIAAGAIQCRQEVLDADEVARILGTTPEAIRIAVTKQRTHLVPPSFRLGRRRVWLRREVLRWLSQQARPHQHSLHAEVPAMDIPRITVGLELVDDEGNEVVVEKLNQSKGTVSLTTDDGDSYSMSLQALRCKLRDGEFARIDPEDENPDIEGDADEEELDTDED